MRADHFVLFVFKGEVADFVVFNQHRKPHFCISFHYFSYYLG